MSYLQSLQFLAQSHFERYLPEHRKTITLRLSEKTALPADLYIPASPLRRRGRARGLVLFIHGMSLKGKDDPRAVNICRSLAGCGYLALAPQFAEVARLEMTVETIDHIRECIRVLSQDRTLCPQGRLSIFTPSFSAGFSMMVAGEKKIAPLVKALFLVGPPGEIQSTAQALLGQTDVDLYGAFIFFKNFIHIEYGKKSPLIQAFTLAAQDNWHNRLDYPETNAYLKKQPRKIQKEFALLRDDPGERLKLWNRIVPREKTGVLNLDILGSIAGLKTDGVYLLHGAGDAVIPPAQSQLLAEKLALHGKHFKLIISPLITHGDAALKPSLFLEILRLWSVFADFFRVARDR